MAELLCLAFESADAADMALHGLQALPEDGRAELVDACVVRRDRAGGVRIKQSVDLFVGGLVGGALLGTACGCLVGAVFIDPSAMVVGAAVGAALGAICGTLSDYGIDDRFIAETAGSIAPGGSALFVLVRRASMESLLARLAAYRPVLLHTSFKPIS